MPFVDRVDAGRKLAERLEPFIGGLFYALPRGGVIIAAEIARTFSVSFDVLVTRKIGAPFNPEYAIGALAETGEIVWNEFERRMHDPQKLQQIVDEELNEARRRIELYRGGRALPSFEGQTVILIDDGLATGYTMRAAILAAQNNDAARVVVALPHGAKESLDGIRRDEDVEIITLEEPEMYGSVGMYYDEFPQVTDEQVLEILKVYGR